MVCVQKLHVLLLLGDGCSLELGFIGLELGSGLVAFGSGRDECCIGVLEGNSRILAAVRQFWAWRPAALLASAGDFEARSSVLLASSCCLYSAAFPEVVVHQGSSRASFSHLLTSVCKLPTSAWMVGVEGGAEAWLVVEAIVEDDGGTVPAPAAAPAAEGPAAPAAAAAAAAGVVAASFLSASVALFARSFFSASAAARRFSKFLAAAGVRVVGLGVAGLAGGEGGFSGSQGFHFPPFFPLVPYRLADLWVGPFPQPRHTVAWAPFQQLWYLLDL